MKKRIGLLFVFLVLFFSAKSQEDYIQAIGLRGGLYSGITYKTFLNDQIAFEGMLTTRYKGVHITGIVEFQRPLLDVRTLYWYYGVGSHIGFYDQSISNAYDDYVIGIDGIIGVEYTFEDYPLNLSLDWNPMINLLGDFPVYNSVGLSVRYCITQ